MFRVEKRSNAPPRVSTDLRPKGATQEEFQGLHLYLMGGFMWIATMTRPDVMDAVQEVARQQAHGSSLRHCEASLKILLPGPPLASFRSAVFQQSTGGGKRSLKAYAGAT